MDDDPDAMKTCPACGQGQLTDHTEQMPAEWNGRSGKVTTHFSICDACGLEIIDKAQAVINEANFLEFRNG